MDEAILGVIYPVSENHFNRIEKGKNIFIKFPVHEINKKSKINLKEGLKIYFYVSRSGIPSKYLIKGEATISKLEYHNLDFIKEKYNKRIPVSFNELDEYSKGREQKKLMVFHLRDFRKYKKVVFIKKPITMNGLYVTPLIKRKINLLV